LENVISNPITHRQIVHTYGSIEEFFKNLSAPKESKANKNFDWMRPMSKEDAQKCRDNLIRWAEATSKKRQRSRK
jgi:hypothetical protein